MIRQNKGTHFFYSNYILSYTIKLQMTCENLSTLFYLYSRDYCHTAVTVLLNINIVEYFRPRLKVNFHLSVELTSTFSCLQT